MADEEEEVPAGVRIKLQRKQELAGRLANDLGRRPDAAVFSVSLEKQTNISCNKSLSAADE